MCQRLQVRFSCGTGRIVVVELGIRLHARRNLHDSRAMPHRLLCLVALAILAACPRKPVPQPARCNNAPVYDEPSCGDGVWNKGEDRSTCPADANAYSVAPSVQLAVKDTSALVGMYIFPGWNHGWRAGTPAELKVSWRPVMEARPNPDRFGPGQELPLKPITGYHDETNPVDLDWMIKWALEHGVHLFVFDWYDTAWNDALLDVFLAELETSSPSTPRGFHSPALGSLSSAGRLRAGLEHARPRRGEYLRHRATSAERQASALPVLAACRPSSCP